MKRAQAGFTLLELMLVVAIAGVLLAIAVPAMGNFIRNGRITAAANDVMAGLHFTRSEAIKRRFSVTLCTSDAPLAVAPACSDVTAPWGWIVFVDTDEDGLVDGEAVLSQHELINERIAVGSSVTPFRVTYQQNGFAVDPDQAQLVFCDERGNQPSGGELSAARGILISVTGRAGVTRNLDEIQELIDAIDEDIGGCEAS